MDARGRRRPDSRHDGRSAGGAVSARGGDGAQVDRRHFAPSRLVRELTRKVQADCAIEVDGNAYSVPWRLIGEQVRVTVAGGRAARRPCRARGRGPCARGRPASDGSSTRLTSKASAGFREAAVIRLPCPRAEPALLRPLAEYEALIGGGF